MSNPEQMSPERLAALGDAVRKNRDLLAEAEVRLANSTAEYLETIGRGHIGILIVAPERDDAFPVGHFASTDSDGESIAGLRPEMHRVSIGTIRENLLLTQPAVEIGDDFSAYIRFTFQHLDESMQHVVRIKQGVGPGRSEDDEIESLGFDLRVTAYVGGSVDEVKRMIETDLASADTE